MVISSANSAGREGWVRFSIAYFLAVVVVVSVC